MIARVLITIGIALYAVAVPILEINDTHVFNPQWPPHARLHEVWQLISNTSIGLLSLWLTWFRNDLKMPAILTFVVTGGFLAAYVLRASYGGSMLRSDGSELTLVGVNAGVLGFGAAFAMAALGLKLARTRGRHCFATPSNPT
jgi:hypothetical protein